MDFSRRRNVTSSVSGWRSSCSKALDQRQRSSCNWAGVRPRNSRVDVGRL